MRPGGSPYFFKFFRGTGWPVLGDLSWTLSRVIPGEKPWQGLPLMGQIPPRVRPGSDQGQQTSFQEPGPGPVNSNSYIGSAGTVVSAEVPGKEPDTWNLDLEPGTWYLHLA